MKYILVLYRKYLPGNLRRIIYGLIIKPYLLFINDPKVFLVDWKWRFNCFLSSISVKENNILLNIERLLSFLFYMDLLW